MLYHSRLPRTSVIMFYLNLSKIRWIMSNIYFKAPRQSEEYQPKKWQSDILLGRVSSFYHRDSPHSNILHIICVHIESLCQFHCLTVLDFETIANCDRVFIVSCYS